MKVRKNIVVLGTFDTKEIEGLYLSDMIRKLGHRAILIDISLKKYEPKFLHPDFQNAKVIALMETTIEELEKMEKIHAMNLMINAAVKLLHNLLKKNEIDGIIGYGGSVGSTMAIKIMKTLPFKIPKIILTTSPQTAVHVIGHSDICVIPSVCDLSGGTSINSLEVLSLARASAAIAGMVKFKPKISKEKPIIVMSQFGVTTPHVIMAKHILEKKGYEVITFHATGIGGQAMEEFILAEKRVVGVLDATTHEIADTLIGGSCNAGPIRLTSAAKRMIPQVILPGALDMVNFRGKLPEKFKNRYFHHHTEEVILMRTSKEECEIFGKIIAEKLNNCKGPAIVIIPRQGWSAYDLNGKVMCVDFYGQPTNKQWHDPAAIEAFTLALENNLDKSKPNIQIIKVDLHINDEECATLAANLLDEKIKEQMKQKS